MAVHLFLSDIPVPPSGLSQAGEGMVVGGGPQLGPAAFPPPSSAASFLSTKRPPSSEPRPTPALGLALLSHLHTARFSEAILGTLAQPLSDPSRGSPWDPDGTS